MEGEDERLLYNINFCRICQIPSNLDLLATSNTHLQQGNELEETYMDILKYIFNDILWIEDGLISVACTLCLKRVAEIADFKRLCYNTNFQRQAAIKEAVLTAVGAPQVSNNNDDTSPHIDAQILTSEIENPLERRGKQGVSKNPTKKKLQHKIAKSSVYTLDKVKTARSYKCDICDEMFNQLHVLQRHVFRHNGTRNYICSICGNKYITQSDLSTHLKLHSAGFDYTCEMCPKKFKTLSNLRTHKNIVHTDPKHVCTECGKKYTSSPVLKVHMKRHSKICDFACEFCEKAFITKDERSKHLVVHSNFRAYKCDLCPAEYKLNQFLLIHKSEVHGIGDYKRPKKSRTIYGCSFCGKSIAHRDKFERHIRSHSGEKPYQCRRCDVKFVCKSYIKPHLKKAHDVDIGLFDATLYYDVIEGRQQKDMR